MAKTARKGGKHAESEAETPEPEQDEPVAAAPPEPKADPKPKAAPKAAPKLAPVREITVKVWSRGRTDNALVAAFVAEQGRVEKKAPAEWMKLFRAWMTKPRG